MMHTVNRNTIGFARRCSALALFLLPLLAQAEGSCQEKVSAEIRVDQGHPWTAPFGVDRVGSPLMAHVELTAEQAPLHEYDLIAYRGGRKMERHVLKLTGEMSPYWGISHLASIPEEVALVARCARDGHTEELARKSVVWPEIEADAVARPDDPINPVDLGTILVPHDWLLLEGGQTAVIETAAISHVRDISGAHLKAWFEGGKPVEIGIRPATIEASCYSSSSSKNSRVKNPLGSIKRPIQPLRHYRKADGKGD